MTPLAEKIAKGLVNIFETGRLPGDYARVAVAPNDRGHLTYGRMQVTLASGNLSLLMAAYCAAPGAQFGSAFAAYLPRLEACDVTLDADLNLRRLLERAGTDPVMHRTQDSFVDRVYWLPAHRRAAAAAVTTPLGIATIFDSTVHGSYVDIRTAADAVLPKPRDEKAWVQRYIAIRRAWLAGNANPSLPPTVYRMIELQRLADAGNWALDPPITVRGITITAASLDDPAVALTGEPPAGGSAHPEDEVVLVLRAARMTGTSVTVVQRALVNDGLMRAADVDGVFGPRTARLVKRFQRKHALAPDGIVGGATWACIRDLGDSTAGPLFAQHG